MSEDNILWSALPIPGFQLSERGQILRMNGVAELLINRSERGVLGQNIGDILSFSSDIYQGISYVFSHFSPVFIEDLEVQLPGQHIQGVRLQIAPIEGGKRCLLLLCLPHKIDGLIASQAPQKAARQAIGIAEMLAHEIKNPLAGIIGAAQLLSMSIPRQDQELTKLIVDESRRIEGLLDQVEHFGDLSPPNLETANIHHVLDRAISSATVGFGRSLTIVKAYDPSLPEVLVDRNQMLQVVLNLLKNATEAMGAEGKITVKTYYESGFSVKSMQGDVVELPIGFEIIDEGPGIDPDIEAHIFEPFISGRENGTGLGLALVSKIVSDHNARISLTSRPGKTVFRVNLARYVPQDHRASLRQNINKSNSLKGVV